MVCTETTLPFTLVKQMSGFFKPLLTLHKLDTLLCRLRLGGTNALRERGVEEKRIWFQTCSGSS
jgi:hypothetical protein